MKNQTGNGIGCGTVLFMIFLVLKLTHVIGWSWWWVTVPLWAPFAAWGLFAAFCLVMAKLAGQR